MEFTSLYERLAVPPPGDGDGAEGLTVMTRAKETVDGDQEALLVEGSMSFGRTIWTKAKETVDNDHENLHLAQSTLVHSAHTRFTATKETIDNDREALGMEFVGAGSAVRTRVAELLSALTPSVSRSRP